MCVRILKEGVSLELDGIKSMFKVIYPLSHDFVSGPFSSEQLSYSTWHEAVYEPEQKSPHEAFDKGCWQQAEVIGFTGFPLRSAAERYNSGNGGIKGLVVRVYIRGSISIGFLEEKWGCHRQDIVWLARGLMVSSDSILEAQKTS